MTFFDRKEASLPVTKNPADYKPGNVVSWDLANNLTHIWIVSHKRSPDGKRPLIVHNIGAPARYWKMYYLPIKLPEITITKM